VFQFSIWKCIAVVKVAGGAGEVVVSILYLRCIRPEARRRPAAPGRVSILYLRCTSLTYPFEVRATETCFNSLFEMLAA